MSHRRNQGECQQQAGVRGGLGWSHMGGVSLRTETQVKVKVESTVIYKLGTCQLQGTRWAFWGLTWGSTGAAPTPQILDLGDWRLRGTSMQTHTT